MPRSFLVLSSFALVVSVSVTAWAAPRDLVAKKKIDEAINKHYVVANFDRAETLLLAAISGCGGQCSAAVTGKAWMYVGVVRGGGKNNQKGAKEAFVNALLADPAVALDDALATPQTKKTFQAAQREAGASSGPVDLGAGGASEGGSDGVQCSLKVTEVQTRRPIPISCTAGENARKLDLKYKAAGEAWKSIKMKRRDDAFRATIPCTATQRAGKLRFYVRAEDANGDPSGGFGKKSKPNQLSIVKQSEEEPPAFPDEEPPKRCRRSDDSDDSEAAATCESSDDCEGGAKCVDGRCAAKKRARGSGPQNWVGLHFAYDFAIVSGDKACSLESQRENGFACFYKGTEQQYRFEPHPKYANDIQSGVSPATSRALVSFEHLFGENVSAGLRVGYAFGGGPPSGKKKEVAFLPYHLEVRASYRFGDSESGVRPYIGAQGGAAQVDAKIPITIGDCGGVPGGAPSKPGATLAMDAGYYQSCTQGTTNPARLELDAYKKLGKGFAGVHGGMIFWLGAEGGIQLDVSVMQMFPTSGQVLEPSLGYVLGL